MATRFEVARIKTNKMPEAPHESSTEQLDKQKVLLQVYDGVLGIEE